MARVEHFFDIPEHGNSEIVGCSDWRMGKRIAVFHVGFVDFSAAAIVVAAFMFLVAFLVTVCFGIFGGFVWAFALSIKIAIVAGLAFVGLIVFVSFCFPERELVIDWQASTIQSRRGLRKQTFALSDLSKVSIVENRISDELIRANVQLLVADEPLVLLGSGRCKAFDEACGKVVDVGERLAEACGVPFELPVEIQRIDLPSIAKRDLAQGYVLAARYCMKQMELADEDGDSKRRERFRGESFDYLTLANQCDPAFATPLLEIAKLSSDDGQKMQAIEQAILADPDSSQALVARAELHEKQDQHELAESDYNAALGFERNVMTLRARAAFYCRRELFEASITDFTEAINRNEDQNLLPTLIDERATCYHDSYESTGSKDDLKLAIADWRRAVSLDPSLLVNSDCILSDYEAYDN